MTILKVIGPGGPSKENNGVLGFAMAYHEGSNPAWGLSTTILE
jgi:hypothetical protein